MNERFFTTSASVKREMRLFSPGITLRPKPLYGFGSQSSDGSPAESFERINQSITFEFKEPTLSLLAKYDLKNFRDAWANGLD